jgi:hypothetical protein
MSPLKYDVKDVEPQTDFDTPIPIGVYKAKITEAAEQISKKKPDGSGGNEMLALTLEITQGDFKGRLLWEYIVFNDASDWKIRQLVDALELAEAGSIKPAKLVGEELSVRVKHESDTDYGVRSRVGALLPLSKMEEDEEEEEEEDETGDESEEEYTYDEVMAMSLEELEEIIEEYELDVKVTKRSKAPTIAAKVADELELEEEDDDDETDPGSAAEDGELEWDDIKDEDIDGLKEINEEYDLGVRITSKSKLSTVLPKVAEALEIEIPEPPTEWDEIADLDLDDLKEINDDFDLGVRITKKSKLETVLPKIAEALEIEEPEEEPEDDDEEEEDYSEWEPADLKAELKERGLKATGPKKTLIKRLEADDEEEDDGEPF